jgi:3-oxoadipate enol-lactonase
MTAILTDYAPGVPRLAYDHCGPVAAPLLVLLHGIGGNRGNWREQLIFFGARGWRAVAWDARGYGLSDDGPGTLDFSDFAHDLARLLDHLDAARAYLIGLSLGGLIAQDFYARYPQRVAALVLCATVAEIDPRYRAEFIRQRTHALSAGQTLAELAPQLVENLLGSQATAAHRQRLLASMSALRQDAYSQTVQAMACYQRVLDPAQIKVPILLIYGAEDRITPPKLGQRLHAMMPGAQFCLLPAAGHVLNIEQTQIFNSEVLAFLRNRTPPLE